VGENAAMRPTAKTPGLPSPALKRDVVVIGVGNPCRSDDGVGIFIARQLKAKNLPQTRIELNRGEAASLMDSWNGSDAAFLVDAVRSGAAPGKIYRFNGQIPFSPKGFFNSSTHNFGPATAVELARMLNRLPRALIIYGIEGKCFEPGRGFTPEVEQAAGTVIKMLLADIFKATVTVSNNTGGSWKRPAA
jgi:hydrogenase maturation protease